MNQQNPDIIPQQMLKKYLIYAKRYMKPKLSEVDQNKITQFYADIRRESSTVGGIPIAVRHIESVIRMSEAFAKLHLRDYVRSTDVDMAIEMLLESFLQSQKLSVSRQLSKKFEKYKFKRQDATQLLLHTLKRVIEDRAHYTRVIQGVDSLTQIHMRIPQAMFTTEVREFAQHSLHDFYKSPAFTAVYKIDGNDIITINKV